MRCFHWLGVLALLCPLPSHAASTLGPALDRILAAPGLQGSISGAEVARVSDRQILYAHNPDLRLMPASNRKLFTAAAALELLGDSYQLKTQVLAGTSPDAQGIVHGDVCLRGGGDGLLTIADLDDLAAQITASGVKRITGGICGDGSYFQGDPYGNGWEWDDLSDDYAPQISGLEANEGFLTAHVMAAGRVGDPPSVQEDPDIGYLPVVDNARTSSLGTPADIDVRRPIDGNVLIVDGTLPMGGSIRATATVADPARFAAAIFRAALIRRGIVVDGAYWSGPDPQATMALATHLSLPLAQYLAKMDKPSDNLLAESLVRVLGAVKGTGGAYDAGLAVSLPFYQSLGIDTGALTLADGSGVSRRNLVTVRAITQLLIAIHAKADWRALYDSLPVAGVDGTLRLSMRGTAAAGNLHAKTGTLTGARALSGYVTGHDGALYAFSLLLNNYQDGSAALAARDQFAEYLAAHL